MAQEMNFRSQASSTAHPKFPRLQAPFPGFFFEQWGKAVPMRDARGVYWRYVAKLVPMQEPVYVTVDVYVSPDGGFIVGVPVAPAPAGRKDTDALALGGSHAPAEHQGNPHDTHSSTGGTAAASSSSGSTAGAAAQLADAREHLQAAEIDTGDLPPPPPVPAQPSWPQVAWKMNKNEQWTPFVKCCVDCQGKCGYFHGSQNWCREGDGCEWCHRPWHASASHKRAERKLIQRAKKYQNQEDHQ